MIELVDIHRIYRIGRIEVPALRGVSLQVQRGEFVSIMGPSGSGKSTLLNIVGCLDRPTEGSYNLEGRDITGLSDGELADLRSHFFGFVFQSFHLLPYFTAQENVELPLVYRGVATRERRRLAASALEEVGLEERLHHRPNELSGGEQQRVAIARALVAGPSVLLADEPTGNLDSRTGKEIISIFQRLNDEQGITIVQVTHERTIASHGQRIIHMRDGVSESDESIRHPLVAKAH